MPTVEGLTPNVLWTTIYGLLALCLLFMVVYKVYDAIHTIVERRHHRVAASKPDFAEEVSQKVIEKLEPRFQRIEENLGKDKSRLDNHETALSGIQDGQKQVRDGLTAICKFMLMISTYGNLGENDKIKDASLELQNFLAENMRR